jgi:hypothetical protein
MGSRRRGAALGLLAICVWAGAFGARPLRAAPARQVGQAAERAANAMYHAFRKGRLAEFVSYTYPVVVQQMGGREQMIAAIAKGRADMEKEGFRFQSGAVASPTQIVEAGRDLHVLLPLAQILTAPGGELHLQGHLLGVSSDQGKTWTFIDTGTLTPENIRQVLPSYNPTLKLPARSEPRFVAKP